MTILFFAVLPAFLLVIYIWLRDKYQREPVSQILRAFVYGIASACIAIVLEMIIGWLGLAPDEPTTLIGAALKGFVGAAMPEEGAKLLMLCLVLRNNKYFDERFDGIVYACCVGLGFAAAENIIYLFSNLENWQSVAAARAISAVPGHFIFAIAMGYFYSMLYFGDMSWTKRNLVFWAPVALHGTYDTLLFAINPAGVFGGLLYLAFLAFCIWLYTYGERRIKEQLKRDKENPISVDTEDSISCQ